MKESSGTIKKKEGWRTPSKYVMRFALKNAAVDFGHLKTIERLFGRLGSKLCAKFGNARIGAVL